jgi:uncharacterized repeat protein (TIGR04052 family)
MSTQRSTSLTLMTACLLAGCSTGGPTVGTPDSGKPVTFRFAAMVGDQPFACSKADPAKPGQTVPATFSGIGTTASTITPSDFRFYVHDVHLLDAAGKATPVTLAQDGKWQVKNVALLDFEDKTGLAVNGTTDTNATVTGTAPAGTYTGVRFTVGVPADLNHADAAAAPSPLNVTAMFWTWQSGYKHARIDFKTTGVPGGVFVHLGSTGCEGSLHTHHETGSTKPAGPCKDANRPTITLTGFDVQKDTVVADLKTLLNQTNVDGFQGMSGCMSEPGNKDCAGIMSGFGLPSGDTTVPAQRFFRVKSGT